MVKAKDQDQRSRGSKTKDPGDSRERLLAAARKVFSRKGFEGATVKDLADEADVNVSLISYHFGGKENLYRACLETFGLARVEATERILQPARTEEEFYLRLRLFMEEFIQIHRTEPEICFITHRDIELGNSIAVELFKKIFMRVFTAFESFVKESQKSEIIRSDIKPALLTGLLFGSFMQFCRGDNQRALAGRPTLSDQKYVNEWLDAYLEIFRSGIHPQGDSK